MTAKHIREKLAGATVASTIRLLDFKTETGEVLPHLDLRLLQAGGYRSLQTASLKILDDAAVGGLHVAGFPDADVAREVATLIARLELAMTKSDTGAQPAGPAYQLTEDGLTHNLNGGDTLYLLRCEVQGVDGIPEKPKKKYEPQLRDAISRQLKLPVCRYLHVVKLDKEHVGDIQVL